MHILSWVSLASRSTLGLGGPAKSLLEADNETDLTTAVANADERGEPVLVLGGGSNVVISDTGFSGLVVCPRHRGIEVRRDRDRVVLDVAAGESLDELVSRACQEGWSGIEALAGIPGLVGATPVQNVGAYGQDISQVVRAVRVYERDARKVVRLAADACGFGYRASVFRHRQRHVILGVELELRATSLASPIRYSELARALGVQVGAQPSVRDVREAVLRLRRSKSMVVDAKDPDSASVGSFFTNPILTSEQVTALSGCARACGALAVSDNVPSVALGDGKHKVSAAWLIERSGFCKGYRRGSVGISRHHALALVHYGGGTTRQLLALAWDVQRAVAKCFGIEIVIEPTLVGASAHECCEGQT